MSIEQIRLLLEIVGYIAGVASVLFLGFQLRKERKLQEYRTLQALEEKYTALLWKAAEHPEIDNVWQKIPKKRKNAFESISHARGKRSWQIWEKMSDEEQNCYRFTRSGLEVLEQAYIAKKKGWINDPEIWKKWEGWMTSWNKTNSYVPYVLKEIEHWFSPSFLKYFSSLK